MKRYGFVDMTVCTIRELLEKHLPKVANVHELIHKRNELLLKLIKKGEN